MNEQGKISFFVDKDYRNRGIGSRLLQVARENLNVSSLSIGFPNNNLLEGFLKKTGFEKNSLAQYEMYVSERSYSFAFYFYYTDIFLCIIFFLCRIDRMGGIK